MRKASAIWQELPIHFKRDVVSHLDLRGRYSLQICSTSDQELVQSSPIFLGKVTIRPPNKIEISSKIYTTSEENLIEIFVRLFKNPKSYAEEVRFCFHEEERQEDVNHLSPLLLERLRSEPKFKVNADIFDYDGYRGKPLGSEFLELLSYFNPRRIEMAPHMSEDNMSQLFETDQWRNAKELRSFGVWHEKTELHPFLRFDRLNIQHIYYLTSKNAWKIIKGFLDRKLPLSSSFHINSLHDLRVDLILSQFNVTPKNESADDQESLAKHTQFFEVENPDHAFVVKIHRAAIYGAVCRREHIEADFRWAVFRVWFQE